MKAVAGGALLLTGVLLSCNRETPGAGTPRPSGSATPGPVAAAPSGGAGGGTAGTYLEVAASSGIRFQHVHGGSGEKYFIETMGSGCVLFDHDGDGDLDAYLVQSGPLPGQPRGAENHSRLYANDGRGRFTEVPEAAGAGNGDSYGMGAVAADYDNDGLKDLYVTNFLGNRLYHNEGDGRFLEVTGPAGVAGGQWSVSASFGDLDGDGLIDLYVADYIDFTMADNKWCGRKAEQIRAYCHPDQYNGVPPRLYFNNGDGTFRERSRESGVWSTRGKGLGVVFSDLDGDRDLDIFGANDSTVNYLWRNRGDGTFEDLALASGAGYNEDGKTQACMGVDAGDYNHDGRFDLFVTNLDLEYNTLYRNDGDFTFVDASYRTGVAEPRLLEVGFGTEFFDYDLDGWIDLFVANGHIIDNIKSMNESVRYAQPKALFHNRGDGTFAEVSEAHPALLALEVSRGAAVGDVDGDGDVDILVSNNNQPASLYRNDGLARGGFLVIELEGRTSNRDALGAWLTVEAGGIRQVEEVRAGTSYGSSGDPRVTFGLGQAPSATLEVRWPAGAIERFGPLPANRWVRIVEGEGRPEVTESAIRAPGR